MCKGLGGKNKIGWSDDKRGLVGLSGVIEGEWQMGSCGGIPRIWVLS